MSAPSYDAETLAGSFRALHAQIYADPVVGPALRHLVQVDPDIIAAVADVDRSQIRSCLQRSPMERLAVASALARTYARFKRVGD